MTRPNSQTWRQDFLRLFSSGVAKDFGEAMALKKRHLPRHLCKFFPPTEHSFEAISSSTVWMASPSTFNDPFDSGLTIEAPTILADLAATSTDKIDGLAELGISGSQLGQIISGQADQALVAQLANVVPEAQQADLRKLLEVIPRVVQAVSNRSLLPQLQEFFSAGAQGLLLHRARDFPSALGTLRTVASGFLCAVRGRKPATNSTTSSLPRVLLVRTIQHVAALAHVFGGRVGRPEPRDCGCYPQGRRVGIRGGVAHSAP